MSSLAKMPTALIHLWLGNMEVDNSGMLPGFSFKKSVKTVIKVQVGIQLQFQGGIRIKQQFCEVFATVRISFPLPPFLVR